MEGTAELAHEFIVIWGVLLFTHWHPNTIQKAYSAFQCYKTSDQHLGSSATSQSLPYDLSSRYLI